PCENVHNDTPHSPAIRTTACTCSTERGITIADAVCSSHDGYAYGSRNSRRASRSLTTPSAPNASRNLSKARAEPDTLTAAATQISPQSALRPLSFSESTHCARDRQAVSIAAVYAISSRTSSLHRGPDC